jgi:hypothetical protein
MRPHKFIDEIAFERAGVDEEMLKGAEKLAADRQRKSRYVIWDLETYALNQESGRGRLVPHVLVATTVCFKCLNAHFPRHECRFCDGFHASDMCLSLDEWRLDNVSSKTSCWSSNTPCDECGQQIIAIRAGQEKDLFKSFIEWLLRDSMHGFTLVAHNGAGFDSPYLFRHLILDYGLSVEPIYSGSKLLQFLVKRTEKASDFIFRAIDSAQFFLSSLKALPKQFGLSTVDMKKGFFPYKFDKPLNWNYVGPFPELSLYSPFEMSSADSLELEKWHQSTLGKEFNFRREMLDYCLQDVRVLTSAMQISVKEDLAEMDFDGMAETCTIAAKTMLYFRHGFLKEDTIGVIPQSGYRGHRNQSFEGMLWLLLQEVEHYPGLQHAFSVHGEKSICGAPVDGFHEETNTVLQFHG